MNMRKLSGIALLVLSAIGLWLMSGTINVLVMTADGYTYRQVNGVGWIVVMICAACGMVIIAGLRLLLTPGARRLPQPAPASQL